MIPAEERLVVGVHVVPRNDRREPPPVDGFQEFGENGRSKAHVPPSTFRVSTTRKYQGIPLESLGLRDMRRNILNHSSHFPDSPARHGKVNMSIRSPIAGRLTGT